MNGTATPTPTFVVIGCRRAALRWLRRNLEHHPDVYLADPSDEFMLGSGTASFGSYLRQFAGAAGFGAIGHFAPGFTRPSSNPRRVAARLAATLPDVRLLIVLRQPVDRMVSLHRHLVVHGEIPGDDRLYDLVLGNAPLAQQLELVDGSRYGQILYPFARHFGPQLLAVTTDDIARDPAATYGRIIEHLGIAPQQDVPFVDQVLYTDAHTRWAEASRLDDEERRTLYQLFRRDVDDLEALLDLELSSWDPGAPAGPAPKGLEIPID